MIDNSYNSNNDNAEMDYLMLPHPFQADSSDF